MEPGLWVLMIWEMASELGFRTGIILVAPNSPLECCRNTMGFQLQHREIGKFYLCL